MTLVAIHDAGIAHCAFQGSAVRLSHGLMPHIVGFEHSWTRERKGTANDRLHSKPAYQPASFGRRAAKEGLKGLTLDKMKRLDLYGYAALLLLIFFEVEFSDSGYLPEAKSIKFDTLRQHYSREIDKKQQQELQSFITFIIEQVEKESQALKAKDLLLDPWLQEMPIN